MCLEATWSYITGDGKRFEEFCHEAMRSHVLRGRARTNYRRAESDDSPYDGKTRGGYLGYTGRILFEYKCGRKSSDIVDDLLKPSADGGGDKLRRAKRMHNDAVVYVLVLGKTELKAKQIGKVRGFIESTHLGIAFEIERPQTARGWLEESATLPLGFRAPGEERTLASFIAAVAHQGASVRFPQYARLEEVYVPPTELDRARRILEEKHILLLVGPPHVGKTFTAAYLLWYFYSVGNRYPHWVLPKPLEPEPDVGGLVRPLREPAQSLTALVTENVGDDKVTYIEDPFGRTSDEEVAWKYPDPGAILSEIAEHVKRYAKDARVIITSRERVLDRAVSKRPELCGLVVRLKGRVRLAAGSYTKVQKRELLDRYARLHACRWAAGHIPADAYDAAEELQTPHAIAYYCKLASEAETPAARRRCFVEASKELVKAFAREIARLDETPLAVLVLAEFFGPWPGLFPLAFPGLAGTDDVAWTGGMAAVSEFAVAGPEQRQLRYIHPAYGEATRLGLRSQPRMRALLLSACQQLARSPETGGRARVAEQLACRWPILDVPVRSLVLKLACDTAPEVRWWVAIGLGSCWEMLDSRARRAVVRLAGDPKTSVRSALAGPLVHRWQRLDASGRSVVRKLAADRNPTVRCWPARSLASEWPNLDIPGRALLSKLAEDADVRVRRQTAWFLAWGWFALDAGGRAMLLRLARDRAAVVRREVAWDLLHRWEAMDEEGLTLLAELAVDPEAAVRSEALLALEKFQPS